MPRKRGNTPSPVLETTTPCLPLNDNKVVDSDKNLYILKTLAKEVTPDKVNSFSLPKSLITDVISPKKSGSTYTEKNGYIIRFNDPDPEKRCILCMICCRNCEFEDLNRCSICPKYYHRRCRMNSLSLKRIHKHEFACPVHFAYSKASESPANSTKRLSRMLHLEHPASGVIKSRQCIAARFKKAYLRLHWRKHKVALMPQKRMRCLVPQIVKDLYEIPQYKVIDPNSSEFIAPIHPYYNRQVDLICQADKKTLSWSGRRSMVRSNETDLFIQAVMKMQGKEIGDDMSSPSKTSESANFNESEDGPSTCVADSVQMNGHGDSMSDISQIMDTEPKENDIDVSSLDKRLLRMLAIDQLRILRPELFYKRKDIEETVMDPNPDSTNKVSHQSELEPSIVKSESTCHAVFTPLSYKGEPIKMMYSQFRIGTGEDCHLVLSDSQDKSGQSCRFVCSHHVTVFNDKYSNEFELLNYGLIGTVVDDVLYAANVDLKRSNSQGGRNKKLERKCNSKLDVTEQMLPSQKNNRIATLLDEDRLVESCQCADSLCKMNYTDISSNVSALLNNGSVIQIGCVKLKFSIESSKSSHN